MTERASTAVIRQWARDNGLPVGDRGRLSPQLLDAYAGSSPPKPLAIRDTLAATPEHAARRHVAAAVHVAVQPSPGSTGIACKIVARSS